MASVASRGAVIRFTKGSGQRYSSFITRADGVCVELVAGGYNKIGPPAGRVPHDLAHFIVEDELRLEFGLWGLLAAGALFGETNTRVVSGRQAPHAARRSDTVLSRGGTQWMQAELAVRVIADLALAGRPGDVAGFRSAMSEEHALPCVTAEQLVRICERYHEAGLQWEGLKAGGSVEVVWRG